MLRAAMWVHGNAVRMESGTPTVRADGARCANHGNTQVIHIPIPTPVILSDARVQLAKVMVLYAITNTGGLTGSKGIERVDLFDGPNLITTFTYSDGSRVGNHSTAIDTFNSFVLPTPHTMLWGLDVVITGKWYADLVVTSAGADFV